MVYRSQAGEKAVPKRSQLFMGRERGQSDAESTSMSARKRIPRSMRNFSSGWIWTKVLTAHSIYCELPSGWRESPTRAFLNMHHRRSFLETSGIWVRIDFIAAMQPSQWASAVFSAERFRI